MANISITPAFLAKVPKLPIIEVDNTGVAWVECTDNFGYNAKCKLNEKPLFSIIQRKKPAVPFEIENKEQSFYYVKLYILYRLLSSGIKSEAGKKLDELWLSIRPKNIELDLEYARLRTDKVFGGIYCPINNVWCILTEQPLSYDSV